MHDVAVLSHIVLALDSHLSGFAYSLLGAECHEVVIFDDLGAYEAFLEVSVDHTGTLRSLAAAHESPGAHLVGTGGEECLKIEQRVSGTYQSGHTALAQTDLGKELLTLLPCVEFGDFAFSLCGYYKLLRYVFLSFVTGFVIIGNR